MGSGQTAICQMLIELSLEGGGFKYAGGGEHAVLYKSKCFLKLRDKQLML